jgi:hypothetical protein
MSSPEESSPVQSPVRSSPSQSPPVRSSPEGSSAEGSSPVQSSPVQSSPEQMRAAVGHYVAEIHRAYVAQALTFPPGVRGQLPLLAPGRLTVVAVAARNLHILATREALGPMRGPEVEEADSAGELDWTLRFFDPVVLPGLALIDESAGPAFAEVRRELGIGTVL